MIVSVAGGKGGIGKTLVAASLALANSPLQFLDCDVEEPNGRIFLRARVRKAEPVSVAVPRFRRWKGEPRPEAAEFCRYGALAAVGEELLVFPELCVGCGGCFLLCPDGTLEPVEYRAGTVKQAVARSGVGFVAGELRVGSQRTSEVIRAVKDRREPGRDTVIDCPPGCGRPVMEAIRGSDFCLLVTEPTPFGLHDLQGSRELLEILGVPGGVVINRSGTGYGGIHNWCREEDIPILEEIPFDRKLAAAAARGQTLPDLDPDWTPRLKQLWEAVKRL